MNRVLVFSQQFYTASEFVVEGRAFKHLQSLLKLREGDCFQYAAVNGPVGDAQILEILQSSIRAKVISQLDPPVKSPWSLAMALSRPKTLARKIKSIVELGVTEIFIFDCDHVDSNYWKSEFLSMDSLKNPIMLGMEQSGRSFFPKVHFIGSFQNLIGSDWEIYFKGKPVYLAIPGPKYTWPTIDRKSVVILGPERGFTDEECETLLQRGALAKHLGAEALSIEVALTQTLSLASVHH